MQPFVFYKLKTITLQLSRYNHLNATYKYIAYITDQE